VLVDLAASLGRGQTLGGPAQKDAYHDALLQVLLGDVALKKISALTHGDLPCVAE